jgi:hypothetical protein
MIRVYQIKGQIFTLSHANTSAALPTTAAAALDTARSPSSLLTSDLVGGQRSGTDLFSLHSSWLGLWIIVDPGFSFLCHCRGGGGDDCME